MRDLNTLNTFRLTGPGIVAQYGSTGDSSCGAFMLTSHVDSGQLFIIASNADGWDHLSVSRRKRCPNWLEMEQVKRMFFRENEIAMQLHVPPEDHIDVHPYCLHLWRPHHVEIPLPPKGMV
jgi:hypothetical protein